MKQRKPNKERGERSSTTPLVAPHVAQALEKTQIAKYHTKGGHGFSAEDANNFADRIRGKQAEVAGITNELNGADRIVDGLRVQSKYFQTASETVAAAFDSATGAYRYSGQVLEVPKDQYEACLELMRDRIAKGRVSGFSDPADAEKIVQKGTITYKQARNIARTGNIDSIVFDAKTQAVTSSYVFAISFGVTFAQNCWRGESPREATQAAFTSAMAAGSTTLITGVVSAQILRTKAAAVGVVTIRSGVKAVSGSTVGREAIHRIVAGSLGKAVYGAAAVNHVSKLLRSNAVTATIATVATTTPDFYRAAFDRSISWRQFSKNLSINVAGVAGGTAGWVGGAAAGAAAGSVVPGIGTAAGAVIGGIAGALAGGIGGSSAAKAVADKVVEDDSTDLLGILREEIESLAFDYMLTEDEVGQIADQMRKTVTPKWLRKMFKEGRSSKGNEAKRSFVQREFEPLFETILEKRPRIELPSPDILANEVLKLVDTIDIQNVEQGGANNVAPRRA